MFKQISLIFLVALLYGGCNPDFYEGGDKKLRIYSDLSHLPRQGKVRAISLEGRALKFIPVEVYRYSNLEYLNLRNNSLTTLPDSIIVLRKLYALFLDDNPLKILPDSIVTFNELAVLTTNGTDILQFPGDFKRLTTLRVVLAGRMPKLSEGEIQRLKKDMPWCNFILSVD